VKEGVGARELNEEWDLIEDGPNERRVFCGRRESV
jgi:hypothetical protein